LSVGLSRDHGRRWHPLDALLNPRLEALWYRKLDGGSRDELQFVIDLLNRTGERLQSGRSFMENAILEVRAALADALQHLMQKGFQFPLHVTIIALNGLIYAARLPLLDHGGVYAAELTELSSQEREIRFPVNCLFVDAHGRTAQLKLELRMPSLETANWPT
jgi:hypothetical protein